MTDNQKTDTKKALPVYLNMVKLSKLIEMLSTTRITTVTTDELKSEFGATDASIAMGALKFLGLVDENGKAKDLVTNFHLKGDDKVKAIEDIVRSSYSELFEFVVDGEPHKLDSDKLENHFMRLYGTVPRISTPAVRAFLYLCEEAGLKDKTTVVKKTVTKPKGEAKTKKVSSPKKTSAVASEEDVHSQDKNKTTVPFVDGQISLVIPTKILSNVDIILDYKVVVEAVQAFAEKCRPHLTDSPVPTNDERNKQE